MAMAILPVDGLMSRLIQKQSDASLSIHNGNKTSSADKLSISKEARASSLSTNNSPMERQLLEMYSMSNKY